MSRPSPSRPAPARPVAGTGPDPAGHRCTRGPRCTWAEVDTDSKQRRGALTAQPDTLCDGCRRRLERALDDIPRLYVELELLLGDHTRYAELVGGTPELPVPIRLDVHDTQAALEAELTCWAEPVAELLGIAWDTQRAAAQRPGVRLDRAAALLAGNVVPLLNLGPTDVIGWIHGPVVTTRTGVDAAVILLDLHQCARFLVTGGSGDSRLPMPCPDCEGTLIRPNGMAHVTCRHCGASWPESDYRILCRVLAQDYRDVAA